MNNQNNDKMLEILEIVLARSKEQAEYYKEIAYKADYKDETINRIVDLGIAFDDVSAYLFKVVKNLFEKQQSPKANATYGVPANSGAYVVDCPDLNNDKQAKEQTQSQVVNSVDNNANK